MLRWEKDINGYNGHWMGGYIGFDDDCPLYKVGEDGDGWYYEYLPDAVGMDGYDTAEDAKLAAEADYAEKLAIWEAADDDDEIDLDVFLEEYTKEDAEADYWDAVAHERMERAKGFID